jgi:hypothetical protein
VLTGASPSIDAFRRKLIKRAIPHVSVGAHLRGLRRSLLLGRYDLAIVCVSLDEWTLQRFGLPMRQLLRDQHNLPTVVRSIGLIPDGRPSPGVAELGCDVLLRDAREAAAVTERWAAQCVAGRLARSATPIADRSIGASRAGRVENWWPIDYLDDSLSHRWACMLSSCRVKYPAFRRFGFSSSLQSSPYRRGRVPDDRTEGPDGSN